LRVRLDEFLVRLDRARKIVATELEHQLEKRRVEDVGVDLAAQHLDHLLEVERVVLMGGGGECGFFDRDTGAGEPSHRRGEALLAHDLGDALGTRDMLGDAGPVEMREAGRLRRAREHVAAL
jgi:hypothetical protein